MFTYYFLNLIIGNLFRTRTSPPIPSRYWIGLSTTAPNVNGGNVSEPTASEYKRIELTGLSSPTNGVIKNTTPIVFDRVSPASWGTVGYYVIFDTAARGGGNPLFYNSLTRPKLLERDDIMRIETNGLTLTFGN